RRGQSREAVIEVQDQIVDILEPDVEADGGPARRPGGRGPDRGAIEWNGEALEATPGGADAEQGQGIEERVHGRLRGRLQHDAEQTAGAGIVAPPDDMAGIAFEGGV